MSRNLTALRRIFPATLALAVAAVTTGCMSGAETAASAGKPDARFVTELAHSSSSELALSQVAVKRATDPQVKQFAQMMVDDHTTQNQTLASVGKTKGMTVPDRPDELHAKAAASLQNTPAEKFDAEYMSTMVADHARTLSVLQDKAATAEDPDIRTLASQQVPIIRAHLEQARQISARLGGRSTVSAGGSGTSGGMSGMHHGTGSTGGTMGSGTGASGMGAGGTSGSGTSGAGTAGGATGTSSGATGTPAGNASGPLSR